MYCYCIEKSEIQKKGSANKNGSHFENFWSCLQGFVLWGLAGMDRALQMKFFTRWKLNYYIHSVQYVR